MTTTSAPPDLASLGDRRLGQILDSPIALAVVCASALPLIVSWRLGIATLICGGLFAAFYILCADGFRGGQSYGKRMMQTAVVDADTGAPCTFGQSFLRNLLLAILGFIDWIFVFGRRRQRRGVGSQLVRRGLEILRERGCPFVVVGHPEYYPRFGFERAPAMGLASQWESIPDETFMALPLDPDVMRGVAGVATYRDEFNAVM